MKVTLIVPPSDFLLDEKVFPSLGVLKVAAVLEDGGIEVEVVDGSGKDCDTVVRMLDRGVGGESDVYGFTATMPQMPSAVKILGGLRGLYAKPLTMLGGPHVTLMHASSKRESKLEEMGRATNAILQLSALFDVLVCGDGERAIWQALTVKRLTGTPPPIIDADDPSSALFLTKKDLNEALFAARHLIDLDSYYYEIDGVRTQSMIAQLGCLVAGTLITKSDGTTADIEDLKKGDNIVCFDDKTGEFIVAPIVQTWTREADDVWELISATGARLNGVTSEHPIWTRRGWRTVAQCEPGDEIAILPRMFNQSYGSVPKLCSCDSPNAEDPDYVRAVRDDLVTSSGAIKSDELVLESVPRGMATNPSEQTLDGGGSARDEGQVGQYVSRGTDRLLEYRDLEARGGDASRTAVNFGVETRRQESGQAAGGSREDLTHGLCSVEGIIGEDEAGLEGRADAVSVGTRRGSSVSDEAREGDDRALIRDRTGVSVCRQSKVLGRAVSVRDTTEPGLRRDEDEARDFSSRRALAFAGVGEDRVGGLSSSRVDAARRLGVGVTNSAPSGIADETQDVLFDRIVSKRFLGSARVYNITVCPGHSYIANGIVVHNCPFGCNFCGGRRSPFLRRVRTRTTERVIAEMRHIYETYGTRGFMFLDDELNVNPQFLTLLDEMLRLQDDLGVEFRMRGLIKSELLTDEMAAKMAKAGFRQLLIGFESGDPRMLLNMNKHATREDNTRCVEILKRHGLTVKALMSFGHPGESEASCESTRRWLLEVQPDDFDVTIITVYPGTPYYDDAVLWGKQADLGLVVYKSSPNERDAYVYTDPKNGDKLYSVDVDQLRDVNFYKGIPGEYQSFVWTDHLTRSGLVALRDDVERDVREKLGIPYPTSAVAKNLEHSMGMGPR